MELKTKVLADKGSQTIQITREFDLPLDLLFRAHVDPEIFAEWMSHEYGTTKVLKLEGKKYGAFRFQTIDAQGNVLFGANGVFQEFEAEKKITRTFEMEGTPYIQLEFLEFEQLTEETSKLTMQMVFRSVELRDELLKRPFAAGLNMSHDRLQQTLNNYK